jgi:two-component system OmpR family sensor kinase
MSWLARLPVRVRVTLAFAGVMALVLGATGLFVYWRLGAELDATINQGLRTRAADLTVLMRRGEPVPAGDTETFAQVGGGLLTPAQERRARERPILVEAQGPEDPVRLLATPVDGRVLVVGAAVDDRNDALRTLAVLLLIGGPIALALASLAGYGAAVAALRPVERMRRRAADIQGAERGTRLPVGPADDEIARLGRTLNEMLGRLEAALERERTFVADASHELRTPLAILKAELELALRAGRTREELEAALRSAAEETDRLTSLAEDLLVIARADDGALPLRPAPLAAAELLGSVAARFPGRAVARAPDGMRVEADPERLKQALGNLVDNALRHGGTSVELAAERSDGRIELHVRDDGPGFPPGFLDAAFERFTRADPARSRGGAGLGLAIVDMIARAHGGEAGARNLPAGGADVWISLPCES